METRRLHDSCSGKHTNPPSHFILVAWLIPTAFNWSFRVTLPCVNFGDIYWVAILKCYTFIEIQLYIMIKHWEALNILPTLHVFFDDWVVFGIFIYAQWNAIVTLKINERSPFVSHSLNGSVGGKLPWIQLLYENHLWDWSGLLGNFCLTVASITFYSLLLWYSFPPYLFGFL